MSEIEHGIADQHHQLVMFATKCARKRLVLSLHNYAFPHPLPELFLSGPELFAIATNDQRRFLFLLLLLFLSHFYVRLFQLVAGKLNGAYSASHFIRFPLALGDRQWTQLPLRHALLETQFAKTCRDPEGKPLQRGRFRLSNVA